MGLKKRAAERRKRIVANRTKSFEDAERWDLEFWLAMTPQERLSVLVDLREDVERVQAARAKADKPQD